VACPLDLLLGLTFGWLAPGAALWLGALGLICIAQRIALRPWPWKQLSAAAAASLALLALAAMEARRQGSFEMVPGGGIVGRSIAELLIGWFGAASALGILLIVLVPCVFATTQLSPLRTAAWAVAGARTAWSFGVTVRARVH